MGKDKDAINSTNVSSCLMVLITLQSVHDSIIKGKDLAIEVLQFLVAKTTPIFFICYMPLICYMYLLYAKQLILL